jgi:uncharacterized protein
MKQTITYGRKKRSFWRRLFCVTLLFLLAIPIYATLFGGAYRPVEAVPQGIVDMHCHLAGVGAGGSGCFVAPRLRDSWRFRIYLKSFGVTEELLLEKGDDAVPDSVSRTLAQSRFVTKAVVLAMDGVMDNHGGLDTNRTEVYVPNEFVVRAVQRHTNFLFGASVNPYRSNALERLDWAKERGAVLVKWIPSIMNIDPADPALVPFYKKLVELDLPLLTHTGKERSFSSSTDELCDPEKLQLPLSLGVKVIAAHIGSTGTFDGEKSSDRLARMMIAHTNLYADISSLTQLNKLRYMGEALTRPEYLGRLIYGSDFPLINTALVSPWHFVWRLSPREIVSISSTKNPWDRDVRIKQALGTPSEIFTRSRQLRIQ